MPKKVLVIESDRLLAQLICDSLDEQEYSVVVAPDGNSGLQKAIKEQPDLVIVDFSLPGLSGNELCRLLRKDPATDHQRILMIADESHLTDLVIGEGDSPDDFLIKPFDTVEFATKVKPLLDSEGEEGSRVISTGNSELDGKMGGGIPLGSLTLIEGASGAGKSVLAQQMIYGSLENNHTLALFSSENTVKSLIRQMRSLNLDVMDHLLLGRIRIYPIELSALGADSLAILSRALRRERDREMIYVDSLTSSVSHSSDREVLGFFEEAKRLCNDGKTIVVVVHTHGLNNELLIRLRSLCDAHLQLRTEEVGQKLVKTLEVTKVRGADKATGNIVSFEVEPGWGMRIIPVNRVNG